MERLMTFSEAIECLREGRKATCKGWNDKGELNEKD